MCGFVVQVMELVELTSLREALVGLPGVSGAVTDLNFVPLADLSRKLVSLS